MLHASESKVERLDLRRLLQEASISSPEWDTEDLPLLRSQRDAAAGEEGVWGAVDRSREPWPGPLVRARTRRRVTEEGGFLHRPPQADGGHRMVTGNKGNITVYYVRSGRAIIEVSAIETPGETTRETLTD